MPQSTLLNRDLLAALAGIQFEGERDLYKILGYDRTLSYDKLRAKYERQDIASRIVDMPASATWRKAPTVKSSNKEFVRKFDFMVNRLKLWRMFERADRLSGIGQYGVILIGVKGNNNLSSPLPNVSDERDILYLSAFSQGTSEILELEESPSNPRFGLPKFYRLKNNLEGSRSITRTLDRVHHSRVIHIAENVLDNEIYGTPRLKPVYNLLTDLEKVVGGSAEMFWLNARQGMQVDIDKDAQLHEDDAKKLEEEIEEFHHQLRRAIRTRGVKINDLGGKVHSPGDTFEMLMSLIAGTVGIPKRILLGSEQGELASTQDRANWSEKVQERRNVHAQPNILDAFIEKMQFIGALPQNDYEVEWPDLLASSQDEKSIIARRYGQAHKSFFEIYGEPLLTREEAAKQYFEMQAPKSESNDDDEGKQEDDQPGTEDA